MTATADVLSAIEAGRECIGAPYIFWGGGALEEWEPMYTNSPGLTADYVRANGVNCSGLINVLRRFALGDDVPFMGTEAYADFINPWEAWDPNKYYPRGTLLLERYIEGVSEGHIAIIVEEDQTILQSTSWYGGTFPGVTEDRTSWDQAVYTPWDWAGFMPDLLPPEGGGPLGQGNGDGTVQVTGKYPGDRASPLELAGWMDYVSKNEFDIEGILPVTCSATELTTAWTGPGDVNDIPGYSTYNDGWSLGYFQQQVGIWDGGQPGIGATREQILDPEWSLRSFLTVAKQYEGQYDYSPAGMGEWCQAVQRSGVPDAYLERGYPIAKELIDQIPATGTKPPKPGEEFDVIFSKYSFVAASAERLAVDLANAAATALEADGVDCLVFNGDENIKMTGDAALSVNDVDKLNCLVVGATAHLALSPEAQARATWAAKEPVWALEGGTIVEVIKKVRDWALSWIAIQEKLDKDHLLSVFDNILRAIDPSYGDLLQQAKGGDLPDPPKPVLTLEQKVNVLWEEHEKGKSND